MTDRTVETMAREAAQMARARFDDPVRRFPPHYINGFCDGVRDGFKEGHASRDEEVKAKDEEIATLRAKLEAAEKRITELEDNEYDPFK